MTHEEEAMRATRTGELTTMQRKFLLAVDVADCDGDVWGEFKGTCPDASHDDFAELWSWAKRMGYCRVERGIKTYHLVTKGRKRLDAKYAMRER